MAHAATLNFLRLPPSMRTIAYRYGRPSITGPGAPSWRARLPREVRPYATVETADTHFAHTEAHRQSNANGEISIQTSTESKATTVAGGKQAKLLEALRDVKARLRLTKAQEIILASQIRDATVARNPVLRLERLLARYTEQPEPETNSTSNDNSEAHHAPDLATIRNSMSLPAVHGYGSQRASRLVESTDFEAAIADLSTRAHCKLKARQSSHAIKSGWKHELRLEIVGICSNVVFGSGINKKSAKQAAWLHCIAKMNSSGAFRALVESGLAQDAEKNADLKTVAYWKNTLPVPTLQQYPRAPKTIFEPATTYAGFVTLYQRLGLPLKADVEYSSRPGPTKGSTVTNCTVKLKSPDSDEIMVDGEGEDPGKRSARNTAWYSVLCKLHQAGTLKEILDDDVPATTKIDQATMKEEKDAKTEIYNFAASLGQVPEFEISKPIPRTFRERKAVKGSSSLVQVTIRLPESGIEVTEIGKGLQMAEIAAAVSFKRAVESSISSGTNPVQATDSPSSFQLLNTDTANQFLEFLQQGQRRWNIEVETESTHRNGTNLHAARLKINSEPQGPEVTMRLKKQAEELAYLVAAVGLARAQPQALGPFGQRLKEGRGQILKPPPSIDLRLDPETLQLMRMTLVDARAAGLPDEREILSAAEDRKLNTSRRQRRRLSPEELEESSQMLFEKQRSFEKDPALEELRRKKAALPMSEYRDQVLNMVSDSPYSIVVGATGSGKTTQVPQILLEDYIFQGKGALCNIVCTQPRRIAATSVAVRVAAERAEPLQQSVGYHVRFDARHPKDEGSITYCTTGILLEQLKHDPDGVLDTISHIAIDEVHERDINIDFLMVVLKKALAKRLANGQSVPKVILMSATLDTELFANYFKQDDGSGRLVPAPSLSVPGRTFPVKEKHLAQLLEEMKAYGRDLDGVLAEDRISDQYVQREVAFGNMAAGTSENETAIDWKRERRALFESEDDDGTAQSKEDAWVPTSLVAATIAHVARTAEDGAILAFLPGLEEITKTQRQLLGSRIFGLDFADDSRFKICLLHSSVPKEDQDQIFQPTPPGCRKIILSTNIAETSVTVTDVKHVIDTGKLRETRYDQMTRISGLQCVWESRSNAKQRAGRAGRVSEGNYYALYSKERSDTMKAVGLPELLRSDLQETCLAVRQQFPHDLVKDFLSQAIEPPAPRAVEAAVAELKSIEAFTEEENLTALGRVLAKLPIHPSLGKMIVIGIVFRCLSPILLLSAAANERSLFATGIGSEAKQRANRSRRAYAEGEESDHIAMLGAFRDVAEAMDRYGTSGAYARSRDNSVHFGAFRSIESTARQIVQTLTDHGLLEATSSLERSTPGQFGPDSVNSNSDNTALIKCLWLSGVYPNLAVKRYQAGVLWRTPTENNALIHQSSINDDTKKKDRSSKLDTGTLLTYSTLSRSNDGQQLNMRDTTVLHPLYAALFGGKLEKTGSSMLVMDKWLPFYVKATDRAFATKLILETRKALDRALNAAFQALSAVRPGEETFLEGDPVIDIFTKRIVKVLNRASGAWVDQLWGDGAQRRAPHALGHTGDSARRPGIDGNWRDKPFYLPE